VCTSRNPLPASCAPPTPQRAEHLVKLLREDVQSRWQMYEQMAQFDV